MLLSCCWSVDTKSLSGMVDEILRVIIWITIPFVNTLETNFGDLRDRDYAIFQ